MTKLAAIRLDVPVLRDEVVTYQTDVMEVCAYANALYNVALPTNVTVDWYAEYALKLRGVRSDVARWELLYQRLFDVPRQILGTSATMKDELNAAIADARALKERPGDALRLAMFRNRLGSMELATTGFANNAQHLAADLNAYTQSLKGHVVVFEEIVKRANGTVIDKQAQIKELNAAIDRLRDQVRGQGAAVAAAVVATAAGVVIGVVAVVLAPFTSGGSLTLLIPAAAIVAGGAVAIGLTAHALAETNREIDGKSKTVGVNAAAVVQLQQVTRTFEDFVQQNHRVHQALERMEARWNALGDVLRAMLADLERAEPGDTPDWDAIVEELKHAQGDWQSVDALAQDLKLVEIRKITNPGSLKVGMTEEEVLEVVKREARPVVGAYMAAAA
jgi:hypothetical protein